MKLYSPIYASLNKSLILAGALSLYVIKANASLLPTPSAPHHQYTVQVEPTNPVTPGVVYASLDARANEKSVIVKWVTAAEMNNSHFEVERSLDMKSFKTVALVLDGFMAEGTGKTYQFKEDAGEVKNGKTVYYRLKQFDTDGKVSYSVVMAVRLESKAVNTMQIFPNPTGDMLSVHLNTVEQSATEIRVVSLSGQTRLSKQSNISKGNTIIQVEGLNQLAPGMYMAQLIMNGKVVDTQKLVKE